MELIRLNDIDKTYHVGEVGVPVLKGVSVRIERGELVALMGASGIGKSTLMNILGCLDHPTSGQHFLDGQEVSNISSDERAMVRNRKIGFVFQSFNLLPRTSALENVMMPLSYTATHLSEKEARARAVDLLGLVGLADRLDHEPSQLSGGQQQRVAIARAFANDPAIILADEPTGNLDLNTGRHIIELLRQMNKEREVTIISATHDHKMLAVSDRIIWIRDGQVDRIQKREELTIEEGVISGAGGQELH